MIRKDIYNDKTVKEELKDSGIKLASEPDEFEVIELPALLQGYEEALKEDPDLTFKEYYYGKKGLRRFNWRLGSEDWSSWSRGIFNRIYK